MDKAVPSAKSASMSISLPVSFPASWSMAASGGDICAPEMLPMLGLQNTWGMANRDQISNKWRVPRVLGHKACGYVDIFCSGSLADEVE